VRVRAQGRAHASEVKREDEFLHTDTNVTERVQKKSESKFSWREKKETERKRAVSVSLCRRVFHTLFQCYDSLVRLLKPPTGMDRAVAKKRMDFYHESINLSEYRFQ